MGTSASVGSSSGELESLGTSVVRTDVLTPLGLSMSAYLVDRVSIDDDEFFDSPEEQGVAAAFKLDSTTERYAVAWQ